KVGRFEDASQRKASAMMLSASVRTAIVVVAAASTLPAQDILKQTKIPPGAKVFVQSMDGFETYLLAAFTKKKTPIVVVDDLDQADFEVEGRFEHHGRHWAEQLFLQKSNLERAAIRVKNRKTGVTAFTYVVEKEGPWKTGQSAAEACAKHLKAW